MRKRVGAVRWLVAHGADVNVRNKLGDSPLMIAVEQRYLSCCAHAVATLSGA